MRSPLTSRRVSPFDLLVLAGAIAIAGTLAPVRAHAEGVWQQLLVPGPRTALSAIRESSTGRIIVFSLGQAWALAPGPSSVWVQLQPTGGGPGTRGGCSVIYDSPRNRLVVFGGQTKLARSNEAWALSLADPPAWTLLAPTGTPPSGRTGHSAILDAPRQRMIVFGGNDGSVKNDVWSLTLSGTPAWTQLSPAGVGPPVARELHSAVYMSASQLMLVFGGRNSAGTPRNDTWALSLSGTVAWGTPGGLIGPATRYGHSAVMDPDGTRMLVYGGTGSAGTPLGDVQSLHWSPSYAWSELTPSQPPPEARSRHAAVADPGTGMMVLIGGTGASGTALGDVWAMRFVTPYWARWWVEENSVLPRRSGHSAVLDAARQRILVFGGFHYLFPSDSAYNDVWAFSLGATPGWTKLTPAGTPPAPRAFHTAIMDPLRDRMIIHGGNCYSTIGWYLTDDVWQLSLSGTPTWSAITTGGSNNPWPAMRERAVYDPVGDCMWVYGGDDIWTTREFVWNLPLGGAANWSLLETPSSSPRFRRGHSAVYDPENRRMLVFGGLADGFDHYGNPVKLPLDDAWRFRADVVDTSWIEVGPAGASPTPRSRHAAAVDVPRNRMLVYGGMDSVGGTMADVVAMPLPALAPPSWQTLVPSGGPPLARYDHTLVYDPMNDRMLVIGGIGASLYNDELCDVWQLSLAGIAGVEPAPAVPRRFAFAAARPNPARGEVAFELVLPTDGPVTLRMFDVAGRAVRTLAARPFTAGRVSLSWDGRDDGGAAVAPGVYLCEARAGTERATRRVVMLR